MLRPGARSFEYRHTPDPREIDQILLPMLEDAARRRTRARRQTQPLEEVP